MTINHTAVHVVSNVNPDARRGDCRACGPSVRLVFKAHRTRWACLASESRRTPEAQARRVRAAKLARYGLTITQYDAMRLAQANRCAICDEESASLVVDHDHSTGVVRGLLCHLCNLGLGHFRDRMPVLERAQAYLAKAHATS